MSSQSDDNFVPVDEEEIQEWFDAEDEDEFLSSDDKNPDLLSRKYSDTQLRVVRSTLDFTLHTLKSALAEPNYINISPSYQRRGRWDNKKKSLLIESFLLNVPIPPLFLFEHDYNQYEVMDGRQRLETISEFLDNQFALTGLEYWPELKGLRFNQMPQTIQRGLLRRTVSAIVLLAETAKGNDDFDIRMVLFRRLNTGGISLNPQELRNALYTGRFNDLLRELSREREFTKLWRIPPKSLNEEDSPPSDLLKNILYKSMADCELVLRFFAIRETIQNDLKGSLKSILDKTMGKNQKINDNEKQEFKDLFNNTLKRLTSGLGYDFILLPGTKRPSRPLFDALMVAASRREYIDISNDSEAIKRRLAECMSSQEQYDILVGRGNTIDAIKSRVSLAEKILVGG